MAEEAPEAEAAPEAAEDLVAAEALVAADPEGEDLRGAALWDAALCP